MKLLKLILLVVFSFCISTLYATEIIFSGEANGNFDLYRTDTEFSHIKRISKTGSNEIMPTVSSDGSKLAFICDKDGANSIYMTSKSRLINISAGMGAYANPSFSPDDSKIAVRYSSDPEEPLKNTKLVLLDVASHTQKVVLDSNKIEKSDATIVVDRPTWISTNLLAYTIIEYSDVEAGRISKSTIYILNLNKNKSTRLAGGESYFDDKGKSLGFRATMPSFINSKKGKIIAFTAIRGAFNRFPMSYSLSKNTKGKINLNDEDYFGPLLFDGKNWIYGFLDENGVPGIAVKKGSLNSKRLIMPFKGRVLSPIIVR